MIMEMKCIIKGNREELKEALRNMEVGQRLGLFGLLGTLGFIVEKYNPNIEGYG